MKKKLLLLILVSALVLSSVIATVGSGTKSDDLALMLPESDGVVVVDVRRLFEQALPQILSGNQSALTKVNTEVEKIRAKTGLDIRKFERVAIGLKTRKTEDGKMDLQPLLLARGSADANSIKEAAELASKGKFRTETIGGRTVYVFSAKEIIDRNKPGGKARGTFMDQVVDKVAVGFADEVALTAYNENTVALGSLERVKALLGDSPRIGEELVSSLTQMESAVANFSMKLPEGMSNLVPLQDDDLDAGLASIREMNGSLDVVPGKTLLFVSARTADPLQAENLQVMVQGFQAVFSAILKRQQGADKQAYKRLLESLTVNRKDDLVTIDLQIPQKDIDLMIGKK